MDDPTSSHTDRVRRAAEELLRELDQARRESEQNLSSLGIVDAYKRVTGRSSLEHAQVTTRRLVNALSSRPGQDRAELPVAVVHFRTRAPAAAR